MLSHKLNNCLLSRGGEGVLPYMAYAGQGMVFVLSVLNRVYSLAQVCPKQGIQFRASLS